MSEKRMTFADFMKFLRTNAGLSLVDAARLLGTGVELLEAWEAGKSLPSELSAYRINQIYGISQEAWLRALKAAVED